MRTAFQTALFAEQPSQGSKALPIPLDFSNVASIAVDVTEEMMAGIIDMVQCVFVDNHLNSAAVSLQFDNGTTQGYIVNIQPYFEGFYPVLVPHGATRFVAATTQGVGIIPIALCSMPFPFIEWGPPDGVAQVPVLTNVALDGSAIVGGADIPLVAAGIGQTVRLYRGVFTVDAPTILRFTDGSGGTVLFAALLTAGGSLSFGPPTGVSWFSTSAGNGLFLASSANVNVYGGFGYVQA